MRGFFVSVIVVNVHWSGQVKINSAVNAELRKELVSAGEFVQTKKMVLLK
ncbi:MAG TPA: hypothetical protein QGH56_04360 [Candidatus Marinimicrobia bacterium]|jgi:hypothetical protein|nr:hypothetical protein [Candidatus Neomarinimicrobiota bacterium]